MLVANHCYVLPMHLYILAGHNYHILISTNDLPIATDAFFLLPMFYQCEKESVFTNLCQSYLV